MAVIKGLKSPQGRDLILVVVGCAIALLGFFSSDKINIEGGFGWDGRIFGGLARDFYEYYKSGVNYFYVGRSLPSFLVFHTLQFLGIERSNPNVVAAFGLFNVAAITLSVWGWCAIARSQKLSQQGKWLGAIGLFLNFALLKYPSYYPTLTDCFAWVISVFLLYFYLKQNTVWIFILTFLGAFSWSTTLYIGGILLLFPPPKTVEVNPRPAPRQANLIGATIFATGTLIYAIALLKTDSAIRTITSETPIFRPASALSVALSVGYLLLGLTSLLNSRNLFSIRAWLSPFKTRQFYLALVFIVSILVLQKLLATKPGTVISFGHILELTLWRSLKDPGTFWVSHVAYFGPIFIFATFYWRSICRRIHQYGLGLTLCFTLCFILSLNTESRYLVNFFPFLVFFTVKVLEERPWTAAKLCGLAIVALFLSKAWFAIGKIEVSGNFQQFPTQAYFMSQGPWMSHAMYAVQGGFILLISYWLYDYYVRKT
jgi:hypothetical protein